jgi:peptidoglycan-N-acetylglucosamine deacetylase
MRLTPFFVWVVGFGCANIGLLALPRCRYAFAGLLLLHFIVLVWGIVNIRSQFFGKVYFRGETTGKRIAITFDDGPDPGLTEAILDLLDRYKMRAAFFVIGRRAGQFPHIVKRAFGSGHVIACHDQKHHWGSNFRTTGALFRDILAARQIIERIIGKKPLLYRPPMGLMNPHVPIALARSNMVCIGWSERLFDSGNKREIKLYKMPKLARPGAVIMLHDCLPKAENKAVFLEQFEKLLKAIRENRLQTVGVDELLGLKAYG